MINTRFKDAPWIPKEEDTFSNVIIGGAGGIGSWTALFLARAGFSPIVFDFDILEEHNLGGQLFQYEDVGLSKVEALYNIINKLSNKKIEFSSDKIEENFEVFPYMISAFDNMMARKHMFNAWRKCQQGLFIDGRLSMESFEIYCVTPDRAEEYEKTLFEDEEVEDLPCTMKQTSHVAAMIGSHITSLYTNYVTNLKSEKEVRVLPFKYEFFIPLYL